MKFAFSILRLNIKFAEKFLSKIQVSIFVRESLSER